MVGATVRVFSDAPAKFAEGHHNYTIKNSFSFQIIAKSGQRSSEIIQQTLVRVNLTGVRVVPPWVA